VLQILHANHADCGHCALNIKIQFNGAASPAG
jgi:hypothetical protein